ncbi:MAG TPA: DMT family transporter, partial [Acidimicrobiia bacterium]|nr:DMT family transporter [Acidimicrobiia bacterium]
MRARVWAAIVIASLGWGTAGIATRAALREGLGPYTIIGLRTLIAAVAVFLYRALRRRSWPGPRLWGLGAVLGITNITVPYIFFTLALQRASAGFLGLVIANIPLATAVWAHFFLADEPLNRQKALGLSLAVAGV